MSGGGEGSLLSPDYYFMVLSIQDDEFGHHWTRDTPQLHTERNLRQTRSASLFASAALGESGVGSDDCNMSRRRRALWQGEAIRSEVRRASSQAEAKLPKGQHASRPYGALRYTQNRTHTVQYSSAQCGRRTGGRRSSSSTSCSRVESRRKLLARWSRLARQVARQTRRNFMQSQATNFISA